MSDRIKKVVLAVRAVLAKGAAGAGAVARSGARPGLRGVLALCAIGGAGYLLVKHPPVAKIERGNVGIRLNQLNGAASVVRDGTVVLIPGVHELRQLPVLDQIYKAAGSGEQPYQSVEGLALGVDLSVRYAIDPAKLVKVAQTLPDDIRAAVIDPAVQGVIYKVVTRYTVREIFSSKRAEIQQVIEAELKPKLAADGILLRHVTIGKITLPREYMAGMETLLAEELQTEKMRYTLELKEKQVKQTALEADADKIKREKAAEAAGNEQIIAARAQEQAMAHVLPFKQKQIEQRRLEAEAEKTSRIKTSEGAAQARVIEATGEADSRRKLADAEAYRQEVVGKVSTAQMERDGAVITRHPLLIQKTMADKLSDKVSVIIAAPPTDGGFIGAALLGQGQGKGTPAAGAMAADTAAEE
ncbi:SPFH domain-containing protein [Massilia sp. CCM 9210]|uniref:SPFH domain-containing protein n=1 Tax=Massilia scottii TaxID=3057166 RepID=UPI002796D61C|nr:SPFH domain-containing protein [Massilia sp. CCM 9210]MDQ1818085.1 SPFH domain-containing protein [Massilia sp. CCM 9210]